MGLWIREGRRRWTPVRALPAYRPPSFLRISPAFRGPAWWLFWPVGREFGADELPELLAALLQASTVLPGEPELQRIVGKRWELVEGIAPFSPKAVRAPGLLFQRVEAKPALWLVTLHLTRAEGRLLVPEKEKYVGGWWASLHALKEACQGAGGPPAGSSQGQLPKHK